MIGYYNVLQKYTIFSDIGFKNYFNLLVRK